MSAAEELAQAARDYEHNARAAVPTPVREEPDDRAQPTIEEIR